MRCIVNDTLGPEKPNKQTIYVIVDGSYDNRHFFAGYGGVLHMPNLFIKNQTRVDDIAFDGIGAECPSSVSAELDAVLLGVQKVRRLALDIPAFSSAHLVICTDSEHAIQEYANYKNNIPVREYVRDVFEKIDVATNSNGSTIEFRKVTAHVKNSQATLIERLHNQADVLANTAMRTGLRHLFTPNFKKSRYYTVLIDNHRKHGSDAELMKLGYQLASQGMIARVFAGTSENNVDIIHGDHPLIAGIAAYVSDTNGDFDSVIDYAYFNTNLRVNPLDLTLYRHYLYENRDNINTLMDEEDKISKKMESRQAAFACSLIFGSASQNNRKKDVCAFVLDLCAGTPRKGTVRDWVYTSLSYTGVPLKRGSMMRDVPITYRGVERRQITSGTSLGSTRGAKDEYKGIQTVPETARDVHNNVPTFILPSVVSSEKIKEHMLQSSKNSSVTRFSSVVIQALKSDGLFILNEMALNALNRFLTSQLHRASFSNADHMQLIHELYKHVQKNKLVEHRSLIVNQSVLPSDPVVSPQTPISHAIDETPLSLHDTAVVPTFRR